MATGNLGAQMTFILKGKQKGIIYKKVRGKKKEQEDEKMGENY
jgi:hypothetical protein